MRVRPIEWRGRSLPDEKTLQRRRKRAEWQPGTRYKKNICLQPSELESHPFDRPQQFCSRKLAQSGLMNKLIAAEYARRNATTTRSEHVVPTRFPGKAVQFSPAAGVAHKRDRSPCRQSLYILICSALSHQASLPCTCYAVSLSPPLSCHALRRPDGLNPLRARPPPQRPRPPRRLRLRSPSPRRPLPRQSQPRSRRSQQKAVPAGSA